MRTNREKQFPSNLAATVALLFAPAARSATTRRASAELVTLSSAATNQPLSSPKARAPAKSSFASHCSNSAGTMPRAFNPRTSSLAAARDTPALPSRISGESGATS